MAKKEAEKDRGPKTPRAARGRSDDAHAFLPDPDEGAPARTEDEVAEALAEDFVEAATTGRGPGDEIRDELDEEEVGGPFVGTTDEDELAAGTDAANPEDATREALPRSRAGGIARAPDDELDDEDTKPNGK
jgi:hypothetical protein